MRSNWGSGFALTLFALAASITVAFPASAHHRPGHGGGPGGGDGGGEPPPPGPAVLAFDVARSGSTCGEIRLSDLAGAMTPVGAGRNVTWSPEGGRVAFTISEHCEGTTGIYVAGVDDPVPTLLIGVATTSTIAWNPIRDEIAYSNSDGNVFLLNVETLNSIEVVGLFAHLKAWAPDGERLVVDTIEDLVVVTLKENGQVESEPKTIFHGNFLGLDWGRMSDIVVVGGTIAGTNRTKIWCIDVNTPGEAVLIWDVYGDLGRGGADAYPTWSPDDTQLAVGTFAAGLWILDLAPPGPGNACPVGHTSRRKLIKEKNTTIANPDWKRAPN